MADGIVTPPLVQQHPVCIIGAAVVDVIASVPALPQRGGDLALTQQSVTAGGCALNVALALHRLGILAVNALPVGEGVWASVIRQRLQQYGIKTAIEIPAADNGWSLAMVEPDGERTFMSVAGVENRWTPEILNALTVAEDCWIYLSGYQLIHAAGETLIRWLEQRQIKQRIFVDFGPGLADISHDHFRRIMALHPVITVNRQEAILLWQQLHLNDKKYTPAALMDYWQQEVAGTLILRLDQEGAGYCSDDQRGWIPAAQVDVVDTIGAGDSHAGAMLAGLCCGWALCDAVSLANRVAAYVVSQRGGDCAPTLRQLNEFITRN
ncbi:PfkB family carbohydrate kinase [Tatumella citrea]|uniref:Carbohydrate kinase n=1 Tax=Tatumella citrea TaxID=53336 RepID=A0A1Y0L8T0_TATCI|nr:PfkB family carbohydrate kinase [Tatumella citrea]ARU94434.1 carbohydrate kinase [Tatumella citrea]ARU98473.1 carbohydrate kinase [Tatumella citrea]